ncbi:MAG: WcaF family extracellular polysaccharide biosynthesis acetyltransferase [Phycisphaerales bacterium JB043]
MTTFTPSTSGRGTSIFADGTSARTIANPIGSIGVSTAAAPSRGLAFPGFDPEEYTSTPQPRVQPESSPWTLKEKVMRALWMLVGQMVFRLTFHNWYGVRNAILRAFGATVGQGVRVRPSARIEIPWNVELGDGAVIGDHAIIYSLGKITIGARAIVSQYAHLCAGTHDYTDPSFRLLKLPITVGEEAWIAAEAYVAPGVSVGKRAVLGARSNAFKPLEAGWVHVGSPARAIKQRIIAN